MLPSHSATFHAVYTIFTCVYVLVCLSVYSSEKGAWLYIYNGAHTCHRIHLANTWGSLICTSKHKRNSNFCLWQLDAFGSIVHSTIQAPPILLPTHHLTHILRNEHSNDNSKLGLIQNRWFSVQHNSPRSLLIKTHMGQRGKQWKVMIHSKWRL